MTRIIWTTLRMMIRRRLMILEVMIWSSPAGTTENSPGRKSWEKDLRRQV
jgi:hypothetical protein